MREVGVIGYSFAAIGFLFLTILFVTSWRGRTQGAFLVIASLVSVIWATYAAYKSTQIIIIDTSLIAVEIIHNLVWIAFILFVLSQRGIGKSFRQVIIFAASLFVLIVLVNIGLSLFSGSVTRLIYFKAGFELTVVSQLLVSIFALIMVEQLFRNSTSGEKWSLKYLCFGLGGYFVYNIYLYSDALLYKQFDDVIWVTRGYVSTIIIPLIAVSAARNPQWSLDVFVSRKVVFHTAAVTIIGLYLVIVSLGSYYLGQYGGTWASILQHLLLFVFLLMLVFLIFSGQVRGKLRMSVNKHFFNYKYDYREEWLKFIDTLSDKEVDEQLGVRVIAAIAEVVDSPGGMLWLKSGKTFSLSSVWNVLLKKEQSIYDRDFDSLLEYMKFEKQVVDVNEGFIHQGDKSVAGYHFPFWCHDLANSWLFVPLLRQDELYGVILLTRARAEMDINWENLDLLITVGRQATNDLALYEVNEKLLNSRQFDAFNRLSAYLVHDLKNISAQLDLVVKNATRHKSKPEFVDDAIMTVENSVGKMKKILAQLRSRKISIDTLARVNLLPVIKKALANRQGQIPVPQLGNHTDSVYVTADSDRLTSVLEHLVQNAQDACSKDQVVEVSFETDDHKVKINIEDNGCGMDADYIRSKLFKPFETTKGNAGMGVGMYESREIVKSFDGTISVSSEIGKGTVITLSLQLNDDVDISGIENSASG